MFESQDVSSYLKSIYEKITREIDVFTNERISTADFDEWTEYYHDKYRLEPIELLESYKTIKVKETTIESNAPFFSDFPYRQQNIQVPAYQFLITVPFTGEINLLNLSPSTSYLRRFPATVIHSRGEELDQIGLDFEYRKSEINDKVDLSVFIEKEFNNEFKYYRDTIINVNKEVAPFNQQLKGFIRSCLEKRKARASDFFAVCDKLNIPMKQSENAPNTTPIPLKRVVKQTPSAPQAKKIEPEYGISDTDYQNIQNIIDMFCISCEKTPLTYNKLTEEEIRDTLISTLNTHYSNVTGEAFRKKGKTDILIEFNNKAGYIAECKIWHGIQALQEALSQLNGYMTWRDYKVSLVFFNKTNRDFARVRAQIDEWVRSNSANVNHTKANIWSCLINRTDKDEYFQLSIRVYDLYVAS